MSKRRHGSLGSANTSLVRTIISTDEDHQIDSGSNGSEDITIGTKPVVIKLPKNPYVGQVCQIVADKFEEKDERHKKLHVHGGRYPISGGNIELPEGSTVTLTFSVHKEWIPSGNDALSAELRKLSKQIAALTVCPKIITQAQWFIDAVNGNNTNDGSTPATALKTHQELECRYMGKTALPPVETIMGPFGPMPLRPVRVQFLTDLPSSDPVGLQTTLGPDVVFLYSGTPTVLRTSTINAFSNHQKTNPQKTQTFTDLGFTLADFTDHVRLRISSGPRAGAITYLAEDLGGGIVATLEWSIVNPAPFPGVMPVIPVNGDTFVVEKLIKFTLKGDWFVGRSANDTAFSLPGIQFTDLEFSDDTPSGVTLFNGRSAGGLTLQTHACRVRPYLIIGEGYSFHSNTAFLRGVCVHNGFNFFLGGGCFDLGPQPGGDIGRPHCLNIEFGAGGILDFDFMLYGGPSIIVSESYIYVGTAAVFKAKQVIFPGPFPVPSTGFGVTLYTFGTMQCGQFFSGNVKLWGDGNVEKGMLVDATSAFKWSGFQSDLPTITGLAGVNSDWALDADPAGLTYDVSTTLDGNPPAYVTYRANLWSNLGVSIGGGGFSNTAGFPGPASGGAQNPFSSARIVVSGIVP